MCTLAVMIQSHLSKASTSLVGPAGVKQKVFPFRGQFPLVLVPVPIPPPTSTYPGTPGRIPVRDLVRLIDFHVNEFFHAIHIVDPAALLVIAITVVPCNQSQINFSIYCDLVETASLLLSLLKSRRRTIFADHRGGFGKNLLIRVVEKPNLCKSRLPILVESPHCKSNPVGACGGKRPPTAVWHCGSIIVLLWSRVPFF